MTLPSFECFSTKISFFEVFVAFFQQNPCFLTFLLKTENKPPKTSMNNKAQYTGQYFAACGLQRSRPREKMFDGVFAIS